MDDLIILNKIHYSESFYDFLYKNKEKSKVCKFLYFANEYRSINRNLTNVINYITYRNNGMLSFLPEGKEHKVNDSGMWQRDGRQEGKPAKVIRRLFNHRLLKLFKDSDFEVFNNRYKGAYSCDGLSFSITRNFNWVYNEDIKEEFNGSSLAGSCMNREDFFQIYEDCAQCSLLVLRDEDGNLCGRALMWKIDNITLVDRFYVGKDVYYECFIDYCNANGYWYKRDYKSYSGKEYFINPEGEEVERKFTIHTNTHCDYYPYIDTFSYGEDGYLCNYNVDVYEYICTDGNREGGVMWDDINECNISPNDAVTIGQGEYRGQVTHIDNTVRVNGCTYYENDDAIVYIDGGYHLQEDCVYSDYDGEMYLLENCVYSEYHDSYILLDEAYKVGGDYYHESEVEKC